MFSLYFLIFMLGASIASFLNVYIDRGHIFGRSRCMSCLHNLTVYELIPVFSYLFLKGKCKSCKAKIPFNLFYGELILGIWFLASFVQFLNNYPNKIYFVLSLFLGSVFYLLVIEDMKNMEVRFNFLIWFLLIGLLKTLTIFYFEPSISVFEIFILPLLITSFFWVIYFINSKWIGFADPLIFSSLALFFGSQFALSVCLYSIWLGAFYGIFYLYFIHRKFEKGVPVPFIPIIFSATLFVLIFNYHILKISDILLLSEIFKN